MLKDERFFPCYYPTNRNIINLIRNSFLAIRILLKEKPDLIISSGAAVAVPFFYLGKLIGAKTIYIEVFDRIDAPTLTGKLVYPVTDKFIVQWDEMKKVYPKAINLGGIF
ncbi:oligosaccharide biosynthesis protein Alg14 like protein [Enterococcus faecium]|nr:oligosaccharide biosynthesis protein Alg14 like protein [Enterococcus faecium]MBK4838982.1 oligosaccharide biosynthesis protein Alg14 like protein [Enterococcus faecium]MBK4874018.1 oligosaccharide biosynthesis protein Alg14 like protein [Enterococcus faecium]